MAFILPTSTAAGAAMTNFAFTQSLTSLLTPPRPLPISALRQAPLHAGRLASSTGGSTEGQGLYVRPVWNLGLDVKSGVIQRRRESHA